MALYKCIIIFYIIIVVVVVVFNVARLYNLIIIITFLLLIGPKACNTGVVSDINTRTPCYSKENCAMPLYISKRIKFYNGSITECLSRPWLNTATLSTRVNLAPKPAQNSLNHARLEAIQGHAFWDH